MNPKTAVIVAKAKDNGIGCSDGLPWHIPEELKYFKQRTSGKPVIMGRKTYESIVSQLGSSLPNRTNIIVSRSGYQPADSTALVFSNLEDAIKKAKKIAISQNLDEIFVIGGEEIFKQAIPQADTIYLTKIEANCPKQANAFLKPELFENWVTVEDVKKNLEEKISEQIIECHFQILKRKSEIHA